MTVVRAVSDAEKTEGKPLPGHPPEGGESRRGKSEQEERTTCLSIHPSFLWKEQEEAERAGGSLRTRWESSLTRLGQRHAAGIISHRLKDGWMDALPTPASAMERKTRERHFMSLSPKQVQVMNIRRKIWAGSRLLFSSLSPEELNRLEDAGEEEGSGHLKAPIQLPR